MPAPDTRNRRPAEPASETPAEREVPAGPGDAGASDRPVELDRPVQRHPARRRGSVLWVVVAVIVAIALLRALV